MYETAKEKVELAKKKKGDALYEAIDEWSYFGRYAKTYTEGSVNYIEYGYMAWLQPTVNETGQLVDTGENSLWQYGRSFYGNDYTLIGTYNIPFIIRGGVWSDGEASGIFAVDSGGNPNSDKRFSTNNCNRINLFLYCDISMKNLRITYNLI